MIDAFKATFNASQAKMVYLPDRIQLLGLVDLPVPCQLGTRISADQIDIFLEGSRLEASGNVVFAAPLSQISADRIEFNMADGTGTFHQASGILLLPEANRAEFANQDPEVIFWGNVVEKLSSTKYRITRGGFTTCVQPEPRWQVTTESIVLNQGDYAVARNAVLRVKGVPLFYIPALYYPIEDDQRSTGFLMPTYGTSTLRGTSLSNAFFWALSRSQDATFFHDWFARAGQGAGAEYRYVLGAGSGDFRVYRFAQRQNDFLDDGRVGALSADTSYEARAGVVHALGQSVRVRGRVDYASSLLTQQLYQQSVYRASNPIRVVDGGVSGTWGPLTTGASYQRTEIFSTPSLSTVYGQTPLMTGAIAPTRIFGAPVYASLNSEFAYLPNRVVSNGVTSSDSSLMRVDFAPTVRVALLRLSYLTVNTNAAYRRTYYSRSLNAAGALSAQPQTRTYFSVRSDITGPVLNKIWDTPTSSRTDRMKHVIEPVLSVDYVTDISNASRIPTLYGNTDVIIGASTRFTYGLNNRFHYRSRATGGARGTSHEFLTVGLQQTYYSNRDASRWDYQYSGALYRPQLVDLSPIALTARLSPRAAFSANTRLEYDLTGLGLQTIGLGGSVATGANTANVNYSRVIYTPTFASQYVTASNSVRLMQGRATASYAVNWDLERGYVVNQSVNAVYLAQCCGVQFEYQQFNYPDLIGFPVTSDRRFNFGVVLAGLGTFSNFFGAFGGQP